MKLNKLYCGDCIEVLKTFADNSIDAVVTDPPYGLGFMGKEWDTFDHSQFGKAGEEGENDLKVKKNFKILPRIGEGKALQKFTAKWAEQVFRVLKPGGHLLSFGGTRTYHRMTVAIEDAGFEIRDMIEWIYGSGFPKSLNIHKQNELCSKGLGTALKPAHEPIVVARKPISEKTVADNVLKYGTGGINIDACRIKHNEKAVKTNRQKNKGQTFNKDNCGLRKNPTNVASADAQGRFPANFIHDGSVSGFPKRFFYTAKASKSERNRGCQDIEGRYMDEGKEVGSAGGTNPRNRGAQNKRNNFHPTVKPVNLMKYLIKLVTPKDGVILDCFAGSGTTLVAATKLKMKWIGIELDKDYCKIANKRIKKTQEKLGLGIFAV